MAASSDQIKRVRGMVAEPTAATYNDTAIVAFIEGHATIDERGEEPWEWDASTQPPTREANDDWIPTYDLHAAAADVWEEKAAALAANYDYGDATQRFSRSQAYDNAMKQVRYHRSRRAPKTVSAESWPREERLRESWIGNLPEPE